MLTNARQKMIESIALRDGEVIISHVAKELGVSIETIRRDINSMCAQNLLTKVHGGAVPTQIPISEASYRQRKNSSSAVKNRLGQAAASFVKNHQVIAFSTGTTMEAIASHISGVHDITALTNSLPIADIFTEMYDRNEYDGKVILFGGKLHPTEHLTYGNAVIEQISRYYADILFVGAAALCEDGLTITAAEEGSIASALLQSASKVILVIESRKMDKRSVYRFASLDEVDILITDDEHEISPELKELFDDKHIELHVIPR